MPRSVEKAAIKNWLSKRTKPGWDPKRRVAGWLAIEPNVIRLLGADLVRERRNFIAVTVPGFGNLGRARYVLKLLRRYRLKPHAILPEQMINAASIDAKSIEVVATQYRRFPRFPFALPESVIRAEVNIESWRRTRWNEGTIRRTAYFLAGFDGQEWSPSYFFCELPPGAKPDTVDEAYRLLRPGSVLLADSMFLNVKRQGDMFLIPMRGMVLPKDAHIDTNAYVLRTNHRATNRVIVQDSSGRELTYVRGLLQHRPERRWPDHRQRFLGKTWHLVVKNTVPVTR